MTRATLLTGAVCAGMFATAFPRLPARSARLVRADGRRVGVHELDLDSLLTVCRDDEAFGDGGSMILLRLRESAPDTVAGYVAYSKIGVPCSSLLYRSSTKRIMCGCFDGHGLARVPLTRVPIAIGTDGYIHVSLK